MGAHSMSDDSFRACDVPVCPHVKPPGGASSATSARKRADAYAKVRRIHTYTSRFDRGSDPQRAYTSGQGALRGTAVCR